MEEPQQPLKEAAMLDGENGGGGGFGSIGEDLHRNILSRLPALSYASAACVSRSWNRLCNQILSHPKLLSALSLNPSLEVAINETLDKVLSEPIRPDFAVACVSLNSNCSIEIHKLVRKRLGSRIPIIISEARGTIGSEVHTNEFKEWMDDDENVSQESDGSSTHCGVVLIVGFMPGMKVRVVPFLLPSQEPAQVCLMDKFVSEIEDYTSSVSGCTSPTGILMFTDQFYDLQLLFDKMDYALSKETVIMGGEGGCFLYSNGADSTILGGCQHFKRHQNIKCAAVALVFATDRNKSHGKIQFNLAMSNGVSPVGPIYKGASIRVTNDNTFDSSTWLTARMEGSLEKLDGDRILDHIDNEMENDSSCYDLYIGVTKRRKCYIKSRKSKLISSLTFHEVLGGDEEYLFVKGEGIRSGDNFRFYHPDPETAWLAHNKVCEELRILKQSKENGDKEVVFGGLVFACCGRGESFFGRQNVDSSAFLENFPGVPLAGIFCSGEIGRGNSISTRQDDDRQNHLRTSLHVYSTVYLVMSYTPKPFEY